MQIEHTFEKQDITSQNIFIFHSMIIGQSLVLVTSTGKGTKHPVLPSPGGTVKDTEEQAWWWGRAGLDT